MTNRFIRNLAGVGAISGLSLILACSSDDSPAEVAPAQILPPSFIEVPMSVTPGTTYRIRMQDGGSGVATEYRLSATHGQNSLNPADNVWTSNAQWFWTAPATLESGTEVIFTGAARGGTQTSGNATIRVIASTTNPGPGPIVDPSELNLPQYLLEANRQVTVAIGDPVRLVGFKQAYEGSRVTWEVVPAAAYEWHEPAPAPYAFNSATFEDNKALWLTAGMANPAGTYSNLRVRASYGEGESQTFTLRVRTGATSTHLQGEAQPGSQGQIDTDPFEVSVKPGAPKWIQFNASDPQNGNNRVALWEVNDGTGQEGGACPTYSWISNAPNGTPRPGEMGPEYERYRAHQIKTRGSERTYPKGTLLYMAKKDADGNIIGEDATGSKRVSIGVKATFDNESEAYKNFYFLVDQTNTLGPIENALVVGGIEMYTHNVPWTNSAAGQDGNPTGGVATFPDQNQLVFKAIDAPAPGFPALNVSAWVSFKEGSGDYPNYPSSYDPITFDYYDDGNGGIFDPDYADGDVLYFKLKGAYLAGRAIPEEAVLKANADALLPYLGVQGDDRFIKVYETNGTPTDLVNYGQHLPYKYSSKGIYILEGIDFNAMPLSEGANALRFPNTAAGTIVAGNPLSLIYTATDLAGNTQDFVITINTRTNKAPIVDFRAAGLTASELANRGDVLALDTGWQRMQPTQDMEAKWTLNWEDRVAGLTQTPYRVADNQVTGSQVTYDTMGYYDYTTKTGGNLTNETTTVPYTQDMTDGLYLAITTQATAGKTVVGPTNDVTMFPTQAPANPNKGQLIDIGGDYSFTWLPLEAQARTTYWFNLDGYDKFGAPINQYKMEGNVYGTIYGEPVQKSIYADTGVKTGEANFSSGEWALLNVNPFYAAASNFRNDLPGTYGSDSGQFLLSNAGADAEKAKTDAQWKVYGVPEGHYLLGASHLNGAGTEVDKDQGPVVGPVVYSDNKTKAGQDFSDESSAMLNPGGNLVTYVYLENARPDLSTYAGSGRLATEWDPSLAKYGISIAELDKLDATGTLRYRGTLQKIDGQNLRESANNYFQYSWPSVGQSALVKISSNTGGVDHPYSTVGEQLGFDPDKQIVDAEDVTYNPNSIYELFFDLAAIPYETLDKKVGEYQDRLMVSTLKNDLKNGTLTIPGVATVQTVTNLPYWRMDSTGIVWIEGADKGITSLNNTDDNGGDPWEAGKPLDYTVSQNTEHDFTGNGNNFDPNINRTSFATILPFQTTLAGPAPQTLGGTAYRLTATEFQETLNERLQVLAYVNGTELGPVENHFAVPVYLEFGQLSGNAAIPENATNPYLGELNLGQYQLPVPNSTYWSFAEDVRRTAAKNAVLNYTLTYTDSNTGLSGSMGRMSDITEGYTAAITAPGHIYNVRVTTSNYVGTNPADITTSTAVSSVIINANSTIAPPTTVGGTLVTTAPPSKATPVEAKPFTMQVPNSAGKVWLTWENPVKNYPNTNTGKSGTILEFFDATATITPDSLPIYKVHVAEGVEAFPIPDPWINGTDAGLNIADNKGVVVRLRSITYGEGDDIIKFNEEPFKQAFPVEWADTLTTAIDFSETGLEAGNFKADGVVTLNNIEREVTFENIWTATAMPYLDENGDGDPDDSGDPYTTPTSPLLAGIQLGVTNFTNGLVTAATKPAPTYAWTITSVTAGGGDGWDGAGAPEDTDLTITDDVLNPTVKLTDNPLNWTKGAVVVFTLKITWGGVTTDGATFTLTVTEPTKIIEVP